MSNIATKVVSITYKHIGLRVRNKNEKICIDWTKVMHMPVKTWLQ